MALFDSGQADMRRTADDDETIRKRSGWVIPLGVFLVTFSLSAVFLLLYLAPSAPSLFAKQVSPTSRGDAVALTVGGKPFHIPANYLLYAAARQGGEHKEIALFALLPDFTGWSNWDADAFASNAADSRVVYITLRQDRMGLSEADKFKRVYLDYVSDRTGQPGASDLRQFRFRQDTGYRSEDLFVGDSPKGPIVMRCVRPSWEVPSPSCLRETLFAHGVALSYRFKRAHLEQWRNIAVKVDALIDGFAKATK
jgi:hypothetical protein